MKFKRLEKTILCLLLMLFISTPTYAFAENIVQTNEKNSLSKKTKIKTYKYKNFQKIPNELSLKKKQTIKFDIKKIKSIKFKSTNKRILSISKYSILKARKKGICKLKIYIKKNKKWKIKKKITVYVGYTKKEINQIKNNKNNTDNNCKNNTDNNIKNKDNENNQEKENDVILPQKLVIDNGNPTVNVRINTSIYLSVTIYPDNTTNQELEFIIEDTTIASIDDESILYGLKEIHPKFTGQE